MARTREFSPREALDKAMRLFWRKGFAETSVRDLVEHTGVAHAGLYGTFGGKRELYQSALRHYNATYGDMLYCPLEEPASGRAEIERFFEFILDAFKSNRWNDGCFMVNTAIEFGNVSDDVLGHAKHNIDRMAIAFQGALTRARDRGEVRADLDPARTADLLVTIFHGIAVLARSKASHERVENGVREALRALE